MDAGLGTLGDVQEQARAWMQACAEHETAQEREHALAEAAGDAEDALSRAINVADKPTLACPCIIPVGKDQAVLVRDARGGCHRFEVLPLY